MRRGWTLPTMALTLAATGCLRESNIEPIRETVMVHGIARVGQASIGITLGRVATGGGATPIDDATVRMQRGDDEMTLSPASTSAPTCFPSNPPPPGVHCYGAFLDSQIAPGETFRLTIDLADGSRIVGSTTTPAAPSIEQPLPGADVHIEFVMESDRYGGFSLHTTPIEVRWAGTGRGAADVLLDVERIFDDGAEVTECDDYFFDNTRHSRSPAYLEPPMHCMTTVEDPAWDSAYVALHVVGYDANARDYIAATNETGIGLVLDGASPGLDVVGNTLVSGVFGSAAHATAPLVLRSTVVFEAGVRGGG